MDHPYQKFEADLDDFSWVVDITHSPPFIDWGSRSRIRCAWDDEENFSSRLACRNAAEAELKSAFRILTGGFQSYTAPDSAKGLLTDFKTRLTQSLAPLRADLSGCRTPATAEVVDSLLKCLDATAIIEAVTEVHTRLLENYPCPRGDDYRHLIQIDVNDPSVFEDNIAPKMIAKAFCRYGYNCYPAIQKAQEDIDRLLGSFYADFCAQARIIIRTHVMDPIMENLPALQALLEPAANQEMEES